MSAADVLLEIAHQVRGDTLRLLAATPEDWLTWAPAGTSNHVLWHAGHALWVQDVLFIEPVTGQSELPADWAEMFGMDCRPVRQTNALGIWPRRPEIERLLADQLRRVVNLVGQLPRSALSVDAPVSAGRSLLSAAVHAWHDEAKHQGEMYLLLKLRKSLDRHSGTDA